MESEVEPLNPFKDPLFSKKPKKPKNDDDEKTKKKEEPDFLS